MGSATQPAYVGKSVLGRYTLVRLIGSGAFARVFLAHDPAGREVAVKVLHNLKHSSRLRFAREIKVLQSMPPNPYVASFVDDGETAGGRPVLVMEFVDGITLRETILEHGSLPPRKAVTLVAKLCQAFTGLHELGVVHRDVKPGNILLTTKGVIKLIDFGLIRDAQGILTLLENEDEALFEERVFSKDIDSGILAGTPEYMAPEQLADCWIMNMNEALTDTPSDVFSLGVILFELLTGQRPFSPQPLSKLDNQAEVMAYVEWRLQLTDNDLPVIPNLDPALMSIVHKTLCHDPRLRQPDSRALMTDLMNYLKTGQGVTIDDSHTRTITLENFAADIPTRIIRADTDTDDGEPTHVGTTDIPRPLGDPFDPEDDETVVELASRSQHQELPLLDSDIVEIIDDEGDTALAHRSSLAGLDEVVSDQQAALAFESLATEATIQPAVRFDDETTNRDDPRQHELPPWRRTTQHRRLATDDTAIINDTEDDRRRPDPGFAESFDDEETDVWEPPTSKDAS